MEKYAVDQTQNEEALSKVASSGCPGCGKPANQLQKHGSVIICPKCGSAPFEARDKGYG